MSNRAGKTAFVPNGESRHDTAVILLATAEEYGLDTAIAVFAAPGGFYVTDELADVLYDEDVSHQTSGDRAEEKDSKEE